jgi:hypothetical protein
MDNEAIENGLLAKNSILDLLQSVERNRKLNPSQEVSEDMEQMPEMPIAGKYSGML